jgi:hypothetical protein
MSANKPDPTTVMNKSMQTTADGSQDDGRDSDASPLSLTCFMTSFSASMRAASSRCSGVVFNMHRTMSLNPQPLHASLSAPAAAEAKRDSMSSSLLDAATVGAGGVNRDKLAAAAFLLVSMIACSRALRRGSPEVK